jgi:hypothetical protein
LNVFLVDVARAGCFVDDSFRIQQEGNNNNQLLLIRGTKNDRVNKLISMLKELISTGYDPVQRLTCYHVDYECLIANVWK